MDYVVTGLSPEPFIALYGLSEESLAERGVKRVVAQGEAFFPCRVELEDVAPGQPLLLLNYEHQPAHSPYRSRHAIFVREGADLARRFDNAIPAILASRKLISLRAYDDVGMMIDAAIVPGAEVEATSASMLGQPAVAYIHAHNAARGCFAARIDRA